MESPTLRILLARLDVLVDQVNTLDEQHPFFVINRDDFAFDAFVFAADDLNCIAVMNLHFSRHISLFGIEEFAAFGPDCQGINRLEYEL